jgi:hypothetical protein
MNPLRGLSHSALSTAAALAVVCAAGSAHANPVKVTEPLPCGNGYCDAWAGENPVSCPQDCARKATTPPAPYPYAAPYPYPYPYAPYPYAVPAKPRKWAPGDPPPPGTRVVERPIYGLIGAGAAMLVAGHVLSMALGLAHMDNAGGYSAIPVAGGLIAGSKAQVIEPMCSNSFNSAGCNNSFSSVDLGFYRAAMYTLGVIQVSGVAMIVAGSVVKREKLEYAYPVKVAPLFGPGTNGLAISGTF